jgi:hypothetical protein
VVDPPLAFTPQSRLGAFVKSGSDLDRIGIQTKSVRIPMLDIFFKT